MMIARTSCIACLTVALLTAAANAEQATWMTDYQAALAVSKKTGKPVVTNFTGSDWCGWCIKLKKEVFNKPEFAKWADQNVVLLEIDLPRKKQLPADLQQQNRALVNQYGIRGFPTVLVLNGDGSVVGRTGYLRGGPEKWIANAQAIVDNAKPKVAAIEASLTDALAKAKKDGRALVVMYEPSGDEAFAAEAKKLLSQGAVVELAEHCLSIAHVVADGDNASDAEQVAAAKAMAEQLGAATDKAQLWVVDPTGGGDNAPKMLAQWAGVPSAANLTKGIEDKLPKLTYDGGWIDNYDRARMIARTHDKPMLISFVGSDWSDASKDLHTNVYQTKTFKDFAKDKLVLMKVDFLRDTQQPTALRNQNKALLIEHKVTGFPTLVVLNSKALRVGYTMYEGDAKEMVEKLGALIKS